MGHIYSRLIRYLFGSKDVHILMLGMDGAGKTTLLYKLKLGQVVKTVPTIGLNVETIQHGNIQFTVCDVGQKKLQAVWQQYYINTNSLLFVVDSTDRKRIDEAREELHQTFAQEQELGYTSVLVFANKQDLPDTMSPDEIQEKLKLNSLGNTIKWHVQSCCATTGEGLYEGLDWIAKQLNAEHK